MYLSDALSGQGKHLVVALTGNVPWVHCVWRRQVINLSAMPSALVVVFLLLLLVLVFLLDVADVSFHQAENLASYSVF